MKYILLTLLISAAIADQRSFVWTYEKIMLEAGESELEIYFTNEYPNLDISDNTGINTLTLEAEVEIGMSENLEVSFYNAFKEEPIFCEGFIDNGACTIEGEEEITRKFKYKEAKLRFKYKVFKNDNIWTPLFYSELKLNPDFSEWTVEQKLIFTYKKNNFNFSFNPIIEFENEKEECLTCSDGYKWHRELESEFAMGIAYNRGEYFSYGVDLKSSEYSTYIGPVLAHGNEDKWWTIGIMKKIAGEDEKAELILRSIMGFHF